MHNKAKIEIKLSEEQERDLFAQTSLGLRRELADIKISAQAKKELEKYFQDRKVLTTKDFTRSGPKVDGVSSGYPADRLTDNHRFMIKYALKSSKNTVLKQDKYDRRDIVTELVTAELYRKFLGESQFLGGSRAPIIDLVAGGNEIKKLDFMTSKGEFKRSKVEIINKDMGANKAYISSKFIDDFQTLSKFSGTNDIKIKADSPKLRFLEGFEKIIAACLFLGECDYHGNNLGVITKTVVLGNQLEKRHIITKIDHGRSAIELYNNENELRASLLDKLNLLGYQNLTLNLKKLKEAVDQMLKIGDEEVEQIIKAKLYKLKQIGFDPEGIEFNLPVNGANNKLRISDFDELESFYIAAFRKQAKVMQAFSTTLGVILSMEIVHTHWHNGLWLKTIGSLDPIDWALLHNVTFGAEDPLQWAAKNNITVYGKNAVAWAVKVRQTIDGKEPVAWAAQNNITIEGQDPILWAFDKKRSIEGMDAIIYALLSKCRIDGLHPAVWILQNLGIIRCENPVIFLSNNGYLTKPVIEEAFANGVDVFDILLKQYGIFKRLNEINNKEYKEQIDKIEAVYQNLEKELHPGVTIFDKTTSIGKILYHGDQDTVVRLLSTPIKIKSKISTEPILIDPEQIKQHCSLDLVYRVLELGHKMELRDKNLNWRQTFKDGINSFANGSKVKVGHGLSSTMLAHGLDDLMDLAKMAVVSTPNQPNDYDPCYQSIGKFTEKVLTNRLNNQSTLALGRC